MQKDRFALPAALLAVWLLAGCSAGRVNVVHTFPNALALAAEQGHYQAGAFRVAGFERGLGDYLQQRLAQQLGERQDATAAAGPIRIDGVGRVQIDETQGTRRQRGYASARGELAGRDVATLRRTVQLDVAFTLHTADAVTVETTAEYDSTADPRVRGALGLQRADDPQSQPPVDVVVRELADDCITVLLGMLEQPRLSVDLELRQVWGGDGQRGLRAAGQQDYAQAVQHFQTALTQRPDQRDLHYNLGVVAEADQQLAPALEHYRAAAQGDQGDELAEAGVQRVRRILQRQQTEVTKR